VWLLQVGGVLNSFGNGVVFPFLAIYLHNVRGFGIATAGIAIAISSATQLVAGIAAGPVIDRLGPRRVLGAGLVIQAVGFGLLPLVSEPWHAYALLAFEGVGSAAFWPSQSTLISRLTPPARLHAAFAQQRVTMNLGVGLGGLTGGLIASVDSPTTFTVLFVLDGLTFLAYVGVLFAIRDPGVPPLAAARRPAPIARCCATGCSSGSGRSTSCS
jgi:MFS family permease